MMERTTARTHVSLVVENHHSINFYVRLQHMRVSLTSSAGTLRHSRGPTLHRFAACVNSRYLFIIETNPIPIAGS